MSYEFHENMVIWKKGDDPWHGFGFLGESRHGKTPLSFAFARILLLKDKPEIKIFDDCFTLEEARIRQCRVWGNQDHLGETYFDDLAKAMRESGRSITEVKPERNSYLLGKVAMYLLLFAEGALPFKKQRCHRQEFVETLITTNPFTWSFPKPGKDVVLQRFKDTWSYFIIRRKKETTKELIDLLAHEAIIDEPIS